MASLYKLIRFDVRHGNCGGSLVQFQAGEERSNALPFEIGKVLVMTNIRGDDVRGNHAHYETEEILVALTGGCTVEIDNGKGLSESVVLSSETVGDDQKEALLLYPHLWRTMKNFELNTTLLVVANMTYDEGDYLRDRLEFEQAAQRWSGLGGSAEIQHG